MPSVAADAPKVKTFSRAALPILLLPSLSAAFRIPFSTIPSNPPLPYVFAYGSAMLNIFSVKTSFAVCAAPYRACFPRSAPPCRASIVAPPNARVANGTMLPFVPRTALEAASSAICVADAPASMAICQNFDVPSFASRMSSVAESCTRAARSLAAFAACCCTPVPVFGVTTPRLLYSAFRSPVSNCAAASYAASNACSYAPSPSTSANAFIFVVAISRADLFTSDGSAS